MVGRGFNKSTLSSSGHWETSNRALLSQGQETRLRRGASSAVAAGCSLLQLLAKWRSWRTFARSEIVRSSIANCASVSGQSSALGFVRLHQSCCRRAQTRPARAQTIVEAESVELRCRLRRHHVNVSECPCGRQRQCRDERPVPPQRRGLEDSHAELVPQRAEGQGTAAGRL